MTRVQVVLGRVAALRSQLAGIEGDLREFEIGAEELLHRLAHARRGLPDLDSRSGARPARPRR